MKISAIIIAKNQEKEIVSCLNKISWTDEQIVIDNDSNDNTVRVAKKLGARVLVIPEKNFANLRNEGAKQSIYDWLLYIDTDEEILPSLRVEIEKCIHQFNPDTDAHAYVLKRKNYYLGSEWPTQDGMIRLIYKPSLIEWYGELHETAKIKGSVGELTNKLIHRTHRTLDEMVEKTNQWSTIEAKLRYDTHHPLIVPWRIFRVMATGFYDSYINQGGWKVGTVGLIESVYQGFSLFITYAKLWELQQNKK